MKERKKEKRSGQLKKKKERKKGRKKAMKCRSNDEKTKYKKAERKRKYLAVCKNIAKKNFNQLKIQKI